MRVATVFTGAAAAAVAFAPGAMAAPGHTQAPGHPARAAGKARALAPDIRSSGCTTNTWLHVEYFSPFRELCKAFGFAGKMTPLGAPLEMSAQCGGNNFGTIFWSGGRRTTYGPGTTYREFPIVESVSAVSITHWQGTDKCAWPR
jgi:hypothetical protein